MKHTMWQKNLIGLTLTWRDETPYDYDPAKPIIIVTAGHANPTKNIIVCRKWKQNKEALLNARFKWRMTVNVHYKTPNKKESSKKIDTGEFSSVCIWHSAKADILRNCCEEFFYESRCANSMLEPNEKNYGIYSHCEYELKILSLN
jgi:hypothetical protein